MKHLKGISRILAYDETFEKKVEQQGKNNYLTLEEKSYSRELNIRGRKAFFEEYFDGIKLENQIIPAVGPFEDPRTTGSFIIGYQRGRLLVEQGFDNNKYQKFLEEFQEKYLPDNRKKHR